MFGLFLGMHLAYAFALLTRVIRFAHALISFALLMNQFSCGRSIRFAHAYRSLCS